MRYIILDNVLRMCQLFTFFSLKMINTHHREPEKAMDKDHYWLEISPGFFPEFFPNGPPADRCKKK